MRTKTIDIDGCRITYHIHGKGKPALLVHGFAEDSRIWSEQLELLSESNQLILPELPGTGKSQLLPAPHAGLEDYAEVLKKILDKENIRECCMIGHSMGGYITLAFAEKFSPMLRSFGLFHSSAFADEEEKKVARRKSIAFIRANGAAAFLETAIPGLFYDAGKSASWIKTLLERGNELSADALVQHYEAMIARPDRTAVLKTARKPVLMIIGKHDKAVPFNLSMQQTHLAVATFIYILRDSGHMGMLEETATSNKILADFLQNSWNNF